MTRVAPIGKSADYDHLYKIVLIGDECVGKSSFLNMFAYHRSPVPYNATIGVEFATRTINMDGEVIKLQIWDTAGQERYRSITRSYYRGANGFVAMFDLSSQKTFVNIRANWLRQINDLAEEDTPVVLVGNKLDQAEENGRSLDFESAQEFASDVGVEYYEISSSDKESVDNVLTDLTRLIKSQRKSKQDQQGGGSSSTGGGVTGTGGGGGGCAGSWRCPCARCCCCCNIS